MVRSSRLLTDTSFPLRRIAPESGANRPTTIFIVVDLPAPFGPKRPNTSPAATEKLTSSTATTLPKVFRRLQTSRRFIDRQLIRVSKVRTVPATDWRLRYVIDISIDPNLRRR